MVVITVHGVRLIEIIKKWQMRAKHTLLFQMWFGIHFWKEGSKIINSYEQKQKRQTLLPLCVGPFIQPPKLTLNYSSINALCCLLVALAEQTSRAVPSMGPVAQNRKHFGTRYSWGEMGGGRKSVGRKKSNS